VAEIAGGRLARTVTGVTAAFWQLGSVTVPLVVGVVFQAARSFNSPSWCLLLGPCSGVVHVPGARDEGRSILDSSPDHNVYFDLLKEGLALHDVAMMGYWLMSELLDWGRNVI
jgi:hypothetical protein